MNVQTLVFSFFWQHFFISFILVVTLTLIFKLVKVNAELRSWVWLSAIFSLLLIPIATISIQNIDWESSKTLPVTQENVSLESVIEVPQIDWRNDSAQADLELIKSNESIVQETQLQKDNSNDSFQNNTQKPTTQSNWLSGLTKWVLLVSPYFLYFIIFVSVIKLIWLSVQCLYEFKVKALSSEHIKKNIYYSEQVYVPSLVGLFKSKVLLPINVKSISDTHRQFIIEHELAHLQRKDQVWSLFVRVIDCLIWFNPFFHIMNNGLKHTREVACDNRAIDKMRLIEGLQDTKKRIEIDYASMLVDSVKLFLVDKQTAGFTHLLSKKAFFRNRIYEVVNNDKFSRNNSLWLSLLTCITLFLIMSVFINQTVSDHTLLNEIDDIITNENIIKDMNKINNFIILMEKTN